MLALEALPAAQSRGARIHAQLGDHLLWFISPDSAQTAHAWQRSEDLLRRQLDGVIGDRDALPLTMSDLDDPFVRRVNDSVLQYLDDRGITVTRDSRASGGAPEACVSPLVWLADSIVRHGEAWLLVASPQGHVALLPAEPAGTPRAYAGRFAAHVQAIS